MPSIEKQNPLIIKINNWFENFGKFVVKNKIAFIILTIVIIGVSAVGLKHLKIGLDLDKYFAENDPIILNKKEFTKEFGNNDFVGVLVDADSIFSRDILKVIREVSNELRDSVPFASDVISLTNINYVMPVKRMGATRKMVINTSDINIDSISDFQLKRIISLFENREGIKGRLYSDDYKQTWIVLKLDRYPDKADWHKKKSPIEYVGKIASEIVDKYNLKYKTELKASNFKLTAAGNPVIVYKRNHESMQELILIISLAAFMAILLIVIMTRSFKASVGIIITVAGALIIVFGIKGYMHEMVDSAFMLVPILLTIAVSVAYSIHFTSYYDKTLSKTNNKEQAVIESMKKNGWPIFFAALTTIVSLSSFIFVPITTIKWAGTTAALSIFVVFFLLMLFYPAVLSLGKSNKNVKPIKKSDFWDKILMSISNYVISHGKSITVVFIIVFIIMTYFSSLIEVNLHPKKMFGTKMPHAKEMVYVSESPIATNYFYNILLKSNEKDFFKNLENTKKLVELENIVRKSKSINSVSGFPDKVAEMYQAIKGDKAEYNRLPKKQGLYKSITKRLEKYTPKQMRSWVTEDYSTTQIFVSMPDFESKTFVTHIDSVKAEITKLFLEKDYPKFSSYFTGYAIQFSKMNQYITIGLIRSFGISLLLVFILMSIAFSSLKLGLIALIPNIAPVIIAGGIMGILDLPLEFVTMTIAPMILGLAVDNTIHFINGTRLEFLKTGNYNKSIENTFQTIGQAIIKSTLILCFTLLTFTISDMNNMVNMGMLTVIAIFSASITDFMVTPTIIRLIKPFGKENNIISNSR